MSELPYALNYSAFFAQFSLTKTVEILRFFLAKVHTAGPLGHQHFPLGMRSSGKFVYPQDRPRVNFSDNRSEFLLFVPDLVTEIINMLPKDTVLQNIVVIKYGHIGHKNL